MSTLLFSVDPKKIGGGEDVTLLLESLLQNEVDQKKTYEDDYEKLYHLQSLHLEELLGHVKAVAVLNGNYITDLRNINESYPIRDAKTRLAPLFLKPGEIRLHLTEITKLAKRLEAGQHRGITKWIEFLEKELGSKNLIFEITNPADDCLFSNLVKVSFKPSFVDVVAMPLPEDVETSEGAVTTLSKAVASAYAGRIEPVNLAIYSHIAITNALHHFLYARVGKKGFSIPIGYPDGSQGRPFPILSLSPLSNKSFISLRKIPLTPIGEITDRHPEMDVLVDEYWFRNQVVSVPRPMAETDEISYLYSKGRLEELRGKKIRIGFYQTGYEPAAIGFYRALAEELIRGRGEYPWIEVIPHFYDKWKMTYEVGNSWA